MSNKDQSPSVGGTGKTGSGQHWFISEIQQMMHALGDCRRPLQESAIMVEEITQQQMTTLLYRASDVATMRGAKLIGVEDILFLMKKDKVKLRRLLRYMDMKDTKAAIHRSASVDDEENSETADAKPHQSGKRRKVCYEFLSSIDQTGELLDLFEDEAKDDVKYERLLRADLTSRCLDPKQYLEFCEARQSSFARKHKSQRFKDWLLTSINLDVKPNLHAVELIAYLAYETVAQIVDLALLVKQDMLADTVDPVTRTLPSISHNLNQTSAMIAVMGQSQTNPNLTSPTASPPGTPMSQSASSTGGTQATGSGGKSKPKKKKKANLPHSLESSVVKAIQPSDIQESMRRYTAFVGPFASQLKFNSQLSPKLITLSC
ncbi:transcription initiation protein SPT3 homolog [Mercenaria mercenaria]|uniref:transcription initiation protein SPT3 homolog n=1 Tax=Mercenaria mercenaria TaxID=6596 RepID=UPI00234F1816|nr:transcription initiation protein SPT3 homolog [Mercenaria mercenaria]